MQEQYLYENQKLTPIEADLLPGGGETDWEKILENLGWGRLAEFEIPGSRQIDAPIDYGLGEYTGLTVSIHRQRDPQPGGLLWLFDIWGTYSGLMTVFTKTTLDMLRYWRDELAPLLNSVHLGTMTCSIHDFLTVLLDDRTGLPAAQRYAQQVNRWREQQRRAKERS